MKYFIDTEFHEYCKQPKYLGIKVGKTIPTIDLISIGIVAEDNREYYAISKDFNIKDAWYSWQPKQHSLTMSTIKEYWLRENVLKPIFKELLKKETNKLIFNKNINFTLKHFTKLINKYGKSNKQIAEDIIYFTWKKVLSKEPLQIESYPMPIEFYAYYADYDWVVFAQLYGKMLNLPKGFPMYCKDLKQILDSYIEKRWLPDSIKYVGDKTITFEKALKKLKQLPNYPKQENEHNALDDAKWDFELYKFLKTL